MVPLYCKAIALLPLTREDPNPAGHAWAASWKAFFFPGIGQAGQFFCRHPHYNPELSKVVWKAKFSHCNKYPPLIIIQDDKKLFPIKQIRSHMWGKQLLMNLRIELGFLQRKIMSESLSLLRTYQRTLNRNTFRRKNGLLQTKLLQMVTLIKLREGMIASTAKSVLISNVQVLFTL